MDFQLLDRCLSRPILIGCINRADDERGFGRAADSGELPQMIPAPVSQRNVEFLGFMISHAAAQERFFAFLPQKAHRRVKSSL
jgi:hypothetical protein